jgi:hypothetical protein
MLPSYKYGIFRRDSVDHELVEDCFTYASVVANFVRLVSSRVWFVRVHIAVSLLNDAKLRLVAFQSDYIVRMKLLLLVHARHFPLWWSLLRDGGYREFIFV